MVDCSCQKDWGRYEPTCSDYERCRVWQPIESKPPNTHCEERGEYRSDDGLLWYFKPTHWRPLPGAPNQ